MHDSIPCVSETSVSVHVVHDVQNALRRARALHAKKELEAAHAEIERARSLAFLPEVAEVEARLLTEEGRLAKARAVLEGRLGCNAPASEAVQQELKSLRDRTASITIGASGPITVDGARVAPHGPAELYLEAGAHLFEIQSFEGSVMRRTMAFAGGESERIEVDNGAPHPCLSPCLAPPWRRHEERGPLGITLGPSVLVDVAGGEQRTDANPLSFGARIAPFVRVAGGEWIEVRGGVLAAPSGSARGFTMPVGGDASVRIFPGGAFSFGVGVTSGYLVAPGPSRAAAGVFDPASSFFIEPSIPFAVGVGPFEIENRVGLLWSGQEDAVRSRFALTYVTLTVGLTWIPKKSRDDDVAGQHRPRVIPFGRR